MNCTQASTCQALFLETCENGICSCLNFLGKNCTLLDCCGGRHHLSSTLESSIGVLTATLVCGLLMTLSNLNILKKIFFVKRSVLKSNITRKIYILSWVALITSFSSTSLAICSLFTGVLLVPTFLLDFLAILFHVAALINMTSAFLQLASLKVIGVSEPFYRLKTFWITAFGALLFGLVIAFLRLFISSIVIGVVFTIATSVSVASPLVLFVKNNAALLEGQTSSCSKKLRIACFEMICWNQSVSKFFGRLENENNTIFLTNSRTSSFSKLSNLGLPPIDVESSNIVVRSFSSSITGKYPSKNSTTSNGRHPRTSSILSFHETSSKKIEFYQRSFRTGSLLFLSSVFFVTFWLLFFIFKSTIVGNVSLAAIFWAIRCVFFFASTNLMILYASYVYKKQVKEAILERRSMKKSSVLLMLEHDGASGVQDFQPKKRAISKGTTPCEFPGIEIAPVEDL